MAEVQTPTMMSSTSHQSKTRTPLLPEMCGAFAVHLGMCSSSAGISVHLGGCEKEGIIGDSGHCSRRMWPHRFGLAVSGWGFVRIYICSSCALPSGWSYLSSPELYVSMVAVRICLFCPRSPLPGIQTTVLRCDPPSQWLIPISHQIHS